MFHSNNEPLTHRLTLFHVLGIAFLGGDVPALLLVVAVLLGDVLALLLVLGFAVQLVGAFL